MVSPFFWPLFTRLGEAQILLPLAVVAALWLWLGAGLGAATRQWLISIACAVALTTGSKLAFIGWELGVADWDFTGFSGHAACAAASLPVLAWTLLCGRSKVAQRWAAGLGFALAALVAWSRLEVSAHSASESLSGFALGSLASGISLQGLWAAARGDDEEGAAADAQAPWWLQTALVVSLLLLPVGAPRSRSHDWITALSVKLSGRSQPFVRQDLHRHQPAAASQSSRVSW